MATLGSLHNPRGYYRLSNHITSSMLGIWLLITCICSHVRWVRNATTIICYTPLLEACSTTISFRRSTTLILHTRRNKIKLKSHGTETGTLTITEHHLYPRLHTESAAGRVSIPAGKFWSNLGPGSGRWVSQLLSRRNRGERLCMHW